MNTAKLSFILLMGFYAANAFPCTCAPKQSVKKELKTAASVFVGTVIDFENEPYGATVKFKVLRSYKGLLSEGVNLSVPTGTLCGYNFVLNKTYLVYAFGEGKNLSTTICTRTSPINEAREDLKHLGKGKTPHRYKKP